MSKLAYANTNIIGTSAAPATLTAAYAGNRLALSLGTAHKIGLTVQYTSSASGVANSYVEILLEFSPDGTTWFTYGSIAGTVGENLVYDSPFIVPGDKTTALDTAETISFFIDAPSFGKNRTNDATTTNFRVSVREAASNGTNFGTIWISMGIVEEV